MLFAIDGIPGTLDDLVDLVDENVIIMPVTHTVNKSSLIHVVETLLAQVRQTEIRNLGQFPLLCLYWSQIPFESSGFHQRYIRRHILAIERRVRIPIRRVLVEVDKDDAFEKLAQQHTPVSTFELTQYTERLKMLFEYDRVVHVPPHAFETRSTRRAIFLELIAAHGAS